MNSIYVSVLDCGQTRSKFIDQLDDKLIIENKRKCNKAPMNKLDDISNFKLKKNIYTMIQLVIFIPLIRPNDYNWAHG